MHIYMMVGETGFEPATPCTPCRCATKLRHSPNGRRIAHDVPSLQEFAAFLDPCSLRLWNRYWFA